MDGKSSTPACRDYPRPTDCRNSRFTSNPKRSREDRSAEIEVFEYLQNFGFRSTSTVTTTKKLEFLGVYHEQVNRTHDNLFLKILNTKIMEPCFRLSRRAAGDREHKRKVNSHQQGTKLRQSQSLFRLDSVNEIGTYTRQKQNTRVCKFRHMSKHFTRLLRHGSCHEADGAVRW